MLHIMVDLIVMIICLGGGGVFLHVVPLLNLNVRTPYHDHRHATDIHIGIIGVINNCGQTNIINLILSPRTKPIAYPVTYLMTIDCKSATSNLQYVA